MSDEYIYVTWRYPNVFSLSLATTPITMCCLALQLTATTPQGSLMELDAALKVTQEGCARFEVSGRHYCDNRYYL